MNEYIFRNMIIPFIAREKIEPIALKDIWWLGLRKNKKKRDFDFFIKIHLGTPCHRKLCVCSEMHEIFNSL